MKQPNVAGQFYPEDLKELQQTIETFLKQISSTKSKKPWGLIAPHAGYVYSGQTAAHAYKQIQNKQYDTVIVLSPSHHLPFNGIAILNDDYQTPLGTIPADKVSIEKLLNSNDKFVNYPLAFQEEHALEVQLPFLQVTLKDFQLIPIIIGALSSDNLTTLKNSLTNLQKEKDILIVASTDMAHFNDSATNDEMDRIAINHIKNNDFQGLLESDQNQECSMCGLGPALVLMLMAAEKNTKPEILDHSNSGKTTGDYSSVVGYMSAVYF